jgi:hypothetical protein
MSDYFERVQRELREAVGRRSHLPWYLRIRPRLQRPIVTVLAGLIATGSALAASGVLRSGAPVEAPVPPISNAYEGAVIPGSVHLLALRVADPAGGPPWGLRVAKTTRGLTCVQFGRVLRGRLGVIGRDGAYADDGAFHPFTANFLDGTGCGTDDARGDAFVNEQFHGIPSSALIGDQRHTTGGCYTEKTRRTACPPSELRDVYFGLLGPDAESITRTGSRGATTATAGTDGAYLIVLRHRTIPCSPFLLVCDRSGDGSSTGGPELVPYEVIRAVNYRGGKRCELPTLAQLPGIRATENAQFRAALKARLPKIYRIIYEPGGHLRTSLRALTPAQATAFEALRQPYLRDTSVPTCPPVGYVGKHPPPVSAAQLASKISAHTEPARAYCKKGEDTVPCDGRVPHGYKRINLSKGPPELLLVIEFTARAAVTNFDSHYEINTSNPSDPRNPKCLPAGGGTFGPTQSNLRAGQRVRYAQFVNRDCPGKTHITVGYVTVDGPSGSEPVPGLPGQSAEIPVGQTDFEIP